MKKLFFVVCCALLISTSFHFAASNTTYNFNYWTTKVNPINHELSIVSQQNQIKTSLVLKPSQPAVLKVFLWNINNTKLSIDQLNFFIGKSKLTLTANSIQPERKQKTFSYAFTSKELKKFVHQLTFCNQAYIAYDKIQFRLSLEGSSRSVASALNTISKEHIQNLPSPFNVVQSKNQTFDKSSSYISTVHTIKDSIVTKIKTYNVHKKTKKNLFIAFLSLPFIYCLFMAIPPIRRYKKRKKAFQICKNEIFKHIQKLYIRREQLIYFDHYGTLKVDRWHKEIDFFISKQIKPILKENNLSDYFLLFNKDLRKIIDKVTINYRNNRDKANKLKKNPIIFDPHMTGYDYESFCAKKLIDLGWNAKTTQSSCDQGADVEAEKNGVKIVLQCKLYNKPVGNNAVQQINTAKTFYFAHYAAVVSNAPYTKSARQLAYSAKVFLLHHEELEKFIQNIENKK
ncbi:hypothetical protein COMNV_01327 [Commensalibacter sp. Nvir]|uniref:restriction endonuclease n=1 Tax=Commensalibacter sp. Nvir TaxID=3069817 RepID=UPI002D3D2CE3|nr:hypothetical protein COMNV_01327 [Commensalibacter sp. Nvir]